MIFILYSNWITSLILLLRYLDKICFGLLIFVFFTVRNMQKVDNIFTIYIGAVVIYVSKRASHIECMCSCLFCLITVQSGLCEIAISL